MTDYTDHRAEAERLLADADAWAAVGGELSPEASELACIGYAAVHALLAIHDTLTAKAKPDPQNEDNHPLMDRDGDIWIRNTRGCWHTLRRDCRDLGCRWTRDYLNEHYGPLTPAHDAECSRCGETYPSTAEATMEHHRACTGETPANPMGDPLDEDDHRDRLDCDGMRLIRVGPQHWHPPSRTPCVRDCGWLSLANWNGDFGPLTFAPESAQAGDRRG